VGAGAGDGATCSGAGDGGARGVEAAAGIKSEAGSSVPSIFRLTDEGLSSNGIGF
jgi:hypothetical protein